MLMKHQSGHFKGLLSTNLLFAPQAADCDVLHSFLELFSSVKRWTRLFKSGKDVDPANLDSDTKEVFKFIVPGFDDKQLEKILDSRSKTRYFIQGILSLILVCTIVALRSKNDEELFTSFLKEDLEPDAEIEGFSMDDDEMESMANLFKILVNKGKPRFGTISSRKSSHHSTN